MSRPSSVISENVSMDPLTERIGLIRMSYSKEFVKDVKENWEHKGKLETLVSDARGAVILLNFEEISKIYFSQSRSCRDIQISLKKPRRRRTFSV